MIFIYIYAIICAVRLACYHKMSMHHGHGCYILNYTHFCLLGTEAISRIAAHSFGSLPAKNHSSAHWSVV